MISKCLELWRENKPEVILLSVLVGMFVGIVCLATSDSLNRNMFLKKCLTHSNRSPQECRELARETYPLD